jgi:hypothetical protein
MTATSEAVLADLEAMETLAAMHAVYEMYRRDGRLLYIGRTGRLGRFDEHAEKLWFIQVANIKLTWYPTLAKAQRAEADAIRTKRPVHNIAGNPQRPRPPAASRPDGAVTLADAVYVGLLPLTLTAARKASQRPGFPRPTGKEGPANLYDSVALTAWHERRSQHAPDYPQ